MKGQVLRYDNVWIQSGISWDSDHPHGSVAVSNKSCRSHACEHGTRMREHQWQQDTTWNGEVKASAAKASTIFLWKLSKISLWIISLVFSFSLFLYLQCLSLSRGSWQVLFAHMLAALLTTMKCDAPGRGHMHDIKLECGLTFAKCSQWYRTRRWRKRALGWGDGVDDCLSVCCLFVCFFDWLINWLIDWSIDR